MNQKTKSLIKKFGWAGFFFFLLKGLVWLAVAWWAVS
jgi:hypothetical protein